MKKEFLEQILDVYKDSFPLDSDIYVDYFFKHKYRKEGVEFLEIDGEIVSCLHLFDRNIIIAGKSFACPFIVAAGTKIQHRRKGYMAQVLRNTLNRLYSKGVCVTSLNPFDYNFYAKFGYGPYTYCTEYTVKHKPDAKYSISNLTADEFLSMYNVAVSGYYGYTVRTISDAKAILDELLCDSGSALKVTIAQQGSPLIFYVLLDEGNISELSIFNDNPSNLRVLNSIKELDRCKVNLYGGQYAVPFNMVRIVNVVKLLENLKYKVDDKTLRLKISDNIIEQNNISLELNIRNGIAKVREIKSAENETFICLTIEELVEVVFFDRILYSDFSNINKAGELTGIFDTAATINFDKF